jgi:subtilase family serine protease
MRMLRNALASVLAVAITLAAVNVAAASAAIRIPEGVRTAHHRSAFTACEFPDGSTVSFLHCYTPQQIRSAYGVESVAPISGAPNFGQGATIVLVDPYGSPTAAGDLQHFHDTFFPALPSPSFEEKYPIGNPQFHNTCKNSKGMSGPCEAAGWSEEATLDIEWAYAIAPEAHIVLLAVPPAETEGVQGFPNLFKAISGEIQVAPEGTLFSLSLGVTEQTFGGAARAQTARFDEVFKQGLARGDNFFAASGDTGTIEVAKQHRDSATYPFPTTSWPPTSPYVVAVGGTQLQSGWTWEPASDEARLENGEFNPAYFKSASSGFSEATWNESWGPFGSGGGLSVIYPRPSWQASVDPAYGDHRLIPDISWNAAVNGGVEVYITAYPSFTCDNTTGCWTSYGGVSAATPQIAGLVALVNAARAGAGKAPIGFLDPLLYGGIAASDYKDIVPEHYGSAPPTFAGSDVGVSGSVLKSVGDLVDNQMWEEPIAGYPSTVGYDATTGWGTPKAPSFVADLAAKP